MKEQYKSLFIYFGGKSRVADVVWQALGNVKNYIEMFFGSGAVLFLRPDNLIDPTNIETVNDADGFVCNFFRSLKHDFEGVLEHADFPVNEAELHARHLWLVGNRERITERLMGDHNFYDVMAAGY